MIFKWPIRVFSVNGGTCNLKISFGKSFIKIIQRWPNHKALTFDSRHFDSWPCCLHFTWFSHYPPAVWSYWAIYWTLGNFGKPLATINLPKSPTFFGKFCKGVKIYYFLATFIDIWRFFSGQTVWPTIRPYSRYLSVASK